MTCLKTPSGMRYSSHKGAGGYKGAVVYGFGLVLVVIMKSCF